MSFHHSAIDWPARPPAEMTSIVEEPGAANNPAVDWRDAAACSGQTKLFFAKKAERPEARARRLAKAVQVCGSCPVQQPCKAAGRNNREYGFWGGESETERHLAGYSLTAPIGTRALARHELNSRTG